MTTNEKKKKKKKKKKKIVYNYALVAACLSVCLTLHCAALRSLIGSRKDEVKVSAFHERLCKVELVQQWRVIKLLELMDVMQRVHQGAQQVLLQEKKRKRGSF